MTQFNIEEIKMVDQGLLGLFIVANFAFFIHLMNNVFPWYSLLAAGVGLSIIVLCWSGKKYGFFVGSLLVCTVVHSVYYNWGTLFNIH